MKFAMVVLSGLADVRSSSLDDRTPLEVARTPTLDRLSRSGRIGTVATAPRGAHSGSDVALLTLLGYDPVQHPLRRGPLEAAGADVDFGPDDLVLRGSLVSIYNEKIVDLTAGRISGEEARVLLNDVAEAVRADDVDFHPLEGYRSAVVIRGGRGLKVETNPPHAGFGRPVREVYPRGEDAPRLIRIMDRSREILKNHEINQVRIDLGENPADGLWLWGEGVDRDLPSFESVFGYLGAAVTGAPLARGVARKAGFDVIDVEGATGEIDSDLAAKAQAAIDALDDHDFVFIHVQGANEASHLKDSRRKIRVIEDADGNLVRRLHEHLAGRDDWRMMVASDHITATESDEPSFGRAPFLMAGSDVLKVREYPFDEDHARRSDLQIEDGAELMEFFLGPKRR